MFSGKTERLEGEAGLLRAAELLRGGGTVAFPTETVYGLGADALDPVAVGRIFTAKERPGWDPVIVHVCDQKMVGRVAEISPSLAGRVEALMVAFWPGPLTLLLPRTAAVLDGGATSVGVESTVLDVGAMMIYRPGAVTAEMIAAVAGEVRVFQESGLETSAAPESLPSPGVGLRHYAPRARLVLVDMPSKGALHEAILRYERADEVVGVMLPDEWDTPGARQVFEWGPWGDGEVLARRLFAGLRALDETGVTVIICPLAEGAGVASWPAKASRESERRRLRRIPLWTWSRAREACSIQWKERDWEKRSISARRSVLRRSSGVPAWRRRMSSRRRERARRRAEVFCWPSAPAR